jgi:hypothetical protein
LSPSPYALKVMTVAEAALFPVVLAYQAWTYYTFGHRIGGDIAVAPPTGQPPQLAQGQSFPVMALACWRRRALGRRSTRLGLAVSSHPNDVCRLDHQ